MGDREAEAAFDREIRDQQTDNDIAAERELRAKERRRNLRAFTGIGRSYEAPVEGYFDEFNRAMEERIR